MWSLLPKKVQLTLIFGAGMLFIRALDAVAALWSVGEIGFGKSVSLTVMMVGTILCVIAELTWRWFWRHVPFLQRKGFPDLNGEWRGELISTWINPETGQQLPPILTTITIRQGLFTTTVSLRTGESESHSIHVILERLAAIGRHRIWYDYKNGPKAAYQHRSAPHEGVAYLEIDMKADPNLLEGRYYTARKTTGDIFVRRAPNT